MKKRGGTGIVMLNLGGPATLDDVEPFLLRLFGDRELIQLPMQSLLGPFIAKRRAPKVRALYRDIGGGSPILRWSRAQGEGLCERLDRVSPETAPHRFYIAFRYAAPFTDDALAAMEADGVERVVAFTQYPQYSCSTTGASLNELWRTVKRRKMDQTFTWSVVDRWGEHPAFIAAAASAVRDGLLQYEERLRDHVYVLYSAHSLPLSVIDKGDSYPGEVAATVSRVVGASGLKNPYMLAYQSDVGPVRWLGARTGQVIRQLAAQGHKNVLVVPIAFTSDHIETLSEIDIEYGHLAQSLGMTGFKRAPSLNARPDFLDALSQVVADHLASDELHSSQYRTRCPGCTNSMCRSLPARTVGSAAGCITANRTESDSVSKPSAAVLASRA